jgi:hypothetical protein
LTASLGLLESLAKLERRAHLDSQVFLGQREMKELSDQRAALDCKDPEVKFDWIVKHNQLIFDR